MNTVENRIADTAILIADSHHGQYIPQLVYKCEIDNKLWDWSELSKEDLQALKEGPDNEWYWEAWNNALDIIKISYEGKTYKLYNNEDLWAVPDGDYSDEEWDDWFI